MTKPRRQGYGHTVAAGRTDKLQPRRLTIGDGEIEVAVSRSELARVARIIVGPRRPLEAVVPPAMTMRELDAFLSSKRKWIAQKIAVVEAIASRPHQIGLDRPNTFWRGGESLAVAWRRDTRPVARYEGDSVVVGGRTEEEAAAALERLYRREARKLIRHVVSQQAQRLGLSPQSVAVRDQQTRWGSCSARGNLSFSWRLMLAPSDVLKYVVVHELCHLREPSHSKRYWQILDVARPGWQEPARWLRENGHELHSYLPVITQGAA